MARAAQQTAAQKKAEAKAKKAPAGSMSALREKLNKRYGDQVMRRDTVVKYDVISSGSLSLDLAHRVGGFVVGRMHEIVGPEGVGKTTTVIGTLREAQKKFPKAVAYIDMEQTFDYDWAEANGLDTSDERFLHIFPDDAEDVSDLLRQTVETGLFSAVAVDSIGGMESNQAFDKEAGDQVMGRNAQVITRMVKHCAVLARRTQVTILLVNQYRANVANPKGGDQSAGPKALKYSTTTKTEMSGTGEEPIRYRIPGDTEDTIIGRMVRARVTRSKVAVQGKKGEFYLINYPTKQYGPVGVDQADEGITVGIFTGVIEQGGGGYYTFPVVPSSANPEGTLRLRGREKVADHLRGHPDDLEMVRLAAIAAMSGDVREEIEVTMEHSPETEED